MGVVAEKKLELEENEIWVRRREEEEQGSEAWRSFVRHLDFHMHFDAFPNNFTSLHFALGPLGFIAPSPLDVPASCGYSEV